MDLVIKYGGHAMDATSASDPFLDDVASRRRGGDRIVLVHGGGPQIDSALAERGIVTTRIDGLRVTDAPTLAITESVLCGTVNKALVRALRQRGVRAAGISGQDGGLLVARAAVTASMADFGFVGEIESVDTGILMTLLAAGYVPVVAPIAVASTGSTAYNINADLAAGAIAGALHADAYVIVTNVERVRRDVRDPQSGIAKLTAREARAYLADGTFDGGMRPKISSGLDALDRGAAAVVLTDASAGALDRVFSGGGTTLVRA